jgi:hypothetical protein
MDLLRNRDEFKISQLYILFLPNIFNYALIVVWDHINEAPVQFTVMHARP